MAARKDDSQKPPEGGRRGVIWRLPATQRADAPDAETDRPKDRRFPLTVVLGLAVALVCVGLYAAWSEFGSDVWSAGGQPDAGAVTAATPLATAEPGDGPTDGGAAQSPPADGVTAPLVAAEDGADEKGVKEDTGPGAVGEAASTVGAARSVEADLAEEIAPEALPPVTDSPSSSSSLTADEPETTSSVASARGEEATPERAAEAAGGDQSGTRLPAQVEIGRNALNAFEERLAGIEAQSAAATGAEAAVAALEHRIRVLENDPSREPLGRALTEWTEQRAALETALAEVSEKLAHFEQEAAQQAAADGHLVSLALTTGELTAALGSSRGFAPVLDLLRAIVGDDAEIESVLARLAPFAASGVPTIDALAARFPKAANAIVRTALATEDADWIDETVTRLSQLVTIRRTAGVIDPESVDGRLVEAETALATGDIGRAVAIVEALMPGAAEAGNAHAWLRDARARREADRALAALVATVRARIGARWSSPVVQP